jgi:hypothetical protein
MFVETEVSGASTRNYGRQDAAPSVATAGSARLPPSVAEVVGGETERYYKSPYIPAPVITPTSPIKAGGRPWQWTLMFLILMVGLAMGVLATGGVMRHNRRIPIPAEDFASSRARRDAQRDQENQKRELENRLRDERNKARDAERRAQDAINQMREASEQAAVAGAALAPTGEKLIDLSPYEYPGATASNTIRIAGRELLTMRTTDAFEAVSQFYQKKIGKPVIDINEPWEKKLIFQSGSAPPIAIYIESVPGASGPELKITVLRSPFRLMKPLAPVNGADEP